MTIDFHAHPVPEAFRKWLPLLNIDVIKDDGFPVPQWSKETHLQFMDEWSFNISYISNKSKNDCDIHPENAATS